MLFFFSISYILLYVTLNNLDPLNIFIKKEGANVYLEGYMAPAIRKEGARSKLVFDTENSLKPGTITAQAGASSAGMGSVFYFMTSNTMGNITFNGGDIKAYIRDSDGAAIGGGDYSPGSEITISGGYILAQGGKDVPGIGVKKREIHNLFQGHINFH